MKKDVRINEEEKQIISDFEAGEYSSISESQNKYQEYAKNMLKKNKRINIRLSEYDLIKIQAKAIEEGIPYQTLISSIIHKYVNDKIKQA